MSQLISHLTDYLINHLINFTILELIECMEMGLFINYFRYLFSYRMCSMYSTYIALYSSVFISLI